MLRCFVVLCLLAACGRAPAKRSKPVGYSRETAITIVLVADPPDLAPRTQSAEVASPGTAPPHHYRVTLDEPSHVGVAVLDDQESAFSVVLSTPRQILRPNEVVTGVVEISVSGPTTPYRLHVHAMPELKPR